MRTSLAIAGLLWASIQVAFGDDRIAALDKLTAEYAAAEKEFFEAPRKEELTAADNIRSYETWPGWAYIPRFVALAEARPDDEAAFRACQWIIDRTSNVGNDDKGIFSGDQKAWTILAMHHTGRAELPMLCCQATQYIGPAQEQFLRDLLGMKNLPRENLGFATVALAELLAHKHDYLEDLDENSSGLLQNEFGKYTAGRKSSEWGADLIPANAGKFKTESMQLFRDALARYAEVPVTITAPGYRDLKNLGEKASKSLHALEHLSMGSESPNIEGKGLQGEPLNLRDYRGRVVVLSFWFTGCGPCMALIPQEQRLIETYKDRPFDLLSVCSDEVIEDARKTAAEHKMTWPCWFDGHDGPIARNWNVLGYPTVIVLDKTGKIVAKGLIAEALDKKVAELMDGRK